MFRYAHPLLPVLMLIGGASGAAPDDQPDQAANPEWEVIVSPYLWTTRIDGTVSANGASADLDVSFLDILENLNLGAMGAVEVRRGRFMASMDLFAARMSDDFDAGPATRTVGPVSFQPAGAGPVINVPATAVSVGPLELDSTVTSVVLDSKIGYRVLELAWADRLNSGNAEPDPRRLTLDLSIGARYWFMRTELDVELGPITVPGFTITASLPALPSLDLPGVSVPGVSFGGVNETITENVDWLDLTVGGRIGFDFTDRVSISVIGDIGGFDIGSSSHQTWLAMGLMGYRLSDRWTLRAGYKALGTERGPIDMTLHGLLLGASRRF